MTPEHLTDIAAEIGPELDRLSKLRKATAELHFNEGLIDGPTFEAIDKALAAKMEPISKMLSACTKAFVRENRRTVGLPVFDAPDKTEEELLEKAEQLRQSLYLEKKTKEKQK